MAQPEINFSTSPSEARSSPAVTHTSSSNGSAPPTDPSQARHDSDSPPANGINGSLSATQPNPRSCVTCRKRKVRCDKRHPCSNCNKAAIECIFPGPGRAPRRSRKPPDAELLARLRRLEGVVQHLGKNVDEEEGKVEEMVKEEPMPSFEIGEGIAKSLEGERKIPKNCGLFNGPEPPRKSSVDGATKEFGRLVVDEGRSRYVSNKFWTSLGEEIAEMRDILDDPTEDEDDYPSPGSGPSAAANHQGFIFSFSSTILSLRNFHPPANQVLTYWEVYKENVDPLVKIFHRPCTERTLADAAKDLDHISKPLEVMMFAIYFAAVTSLSDEECINVTGQEKEAALKKYRFAFEQAMARASFLQSTELVILQSFTVFLVCVRRSDSSRYSWTMTGLLIRIAQSLGLQRDGEQFGLSPFETEMRRRLWWQILHLDLRVSEDHGSDPTILEASFDTRFPLNINDDDINSSMKEPPVEREGATEVTFDLIRYTVSTTARRLSYAPPGPGKCRERSNNFTLEKKEQLIEELHQHIENKYLRHCDMTVPLHWVAGTVLRLVLAKMWLIIHHPLQRDPENEELSQETQDRLFRTSVEVIQWSLLLEKEASTKKWGWLFRTYVQWHAVAYVLACLETRTSGPEVDKAWEVIYEILGDMGNHVSPQKRGMLWKPLRKLLVKARAARARELDKRKMFPLDGSIGPAVPGVRAAADPINSSDTYMRPLAGDVVNNNTNGDSYSSNGLPAVNSPPTGNLTNFQPPYLPMDQSEWMYNDPAFPQISQAFNMGTTNPSLDASMVAPNSFDPPMSDGGDASGSGDLKWSDWDEMMKDLPMTTEPPEHEIGFGSGSGTVGLGAGGTMMGGMTNWW
ncbi:MAG: hypothetical protein Q9220_002549 [cf. Caloplaca sp. 1 TL-2023]